MEFHDSTHTDIDNVIHAVARAHAKRFGLSWSQHGLDLIQTGWCGAARASKRYETRGWKFITYAYWFISGDIRRTCTRLATDRHLCVDAAQFFYDGDSESSDHAGNPDFQTALRELLATPDGLELLASELGYRDQSKLGGRIRKEQLERLRARYEALKDAA